VLYVPRAGKLKATELAVSAEQVIHVVVLLCGVRAEFARAMENLGFSSFLPRDRVFREDESAPGSPTLEAIRDAYALLDGDLCAKAEHERFYYMI
jgi:hypothetical protein